MNRALDVLVRPLQRDEKNFLTQVRVSAALWKQLVDASLRAGGPAPEPGDRLTKKEARAFASGIMAVMEASAASGLRARPEFAIFYSGPAHQHELTPSDAKVTDELLKLLDQGVMLEKVFPEL